MAGPRSAPARTKKPVWREVEEAEARRGRGGGRQRTRSTSGRRYRVPYDTSGPKVRLGILWFLGAAAAIAVGPLGVALLYGGAAGTAAAQAARCWRRRAQRPNDRVAALMAGAMGLGACFGAGGTGVATLLGVVAAWGSAAADARSRRPALVDAGWTIQCALPVGLVAASMVLLTRLDQGSALALLLLASAYETGDFLVGSGARNPYEGPVAGGAAIVVVTFILSTMPISALGFGEAWLFGGLVLLLAPLGQLLASAILPAAKAPASALRRLDSLLLAAPLWCWGVGLLIA